MKTLPIIFMLCNNLSIVKTNDCFYLNKFNCKLTKNAFINLKEDERNIVKSYRVFEQELFIPKTVVTYQDENFIYKTYTEPEGTITFSTYVFYLRTENNNRHHFKVYSQAKLNKSFFIRKNDQLVINTAANCYYDNNNEGMYGRYTVDRYYLTTSHLIEHHVEDLKPKDFGITGVSYEHKVADYLHETFKNESIGGSYYFYTSGDSSLINFYVHNQSWILNSLSVNFGVLSISVGGTAIEKHIYSSEPISLKLDEFNIK